jgi:diaminohydroxyphosphoribosylaminopyrimidine deaminase/5-amino-6-(5-phosphoribosylamino)uracil reductase
MRRCLQLALLGCRDVAPNPMVGSVLVHKDRIIGEGYHRKYGEGHAEVNCIASVLPQDRELLEDSTIYVSLEPCAHFGKTPPCANLILEHRIPRVVVGCRDPFVQVDGKGIELLRNAGVEVVMNVLEQECRELNKRFFTFHTLHRPYILLKWAQTADAKIAREDYGRLFISNSQCNRLVHKWRSEEMSILVGTNTALSDDPALTTRLWPGPDPIRLVVDMNLRLPSSLKLFDGSVKTIIFNRNRHEEQGNLVWYRLAPGLSLVRGILDALCKLRIQSVMVEGGTQLLQSFIDEGIWDEARIISNEQMFPGNGIPAPMLKDHRLNSTETLLSNTISIFHRDSAGLIDL